MIDLDPLGPYLKQYLQGFGKTSWCKTGQKQNNNLISLVTTTNHQIIFTTLVLESTYQSIVRDFLSLFFFNNVIALKNNTHL